VWVGVAVEHLHRAGTEFTVELQVFRRRTLDCDDKHAHRCPRLHQCPSDRVAKHGVRR
jgi:hypothetical protein